MARAPTAGRVKRPFTEIRYFQCISSHLDLERALSVPLDASLFLTFEPLSSGSFFAPPRKNGLI